MLLDGKVAIVSGIGPGVGRETALALAHEGADLVLCARTERRLVKLAGAIEALGRRAVPAPTDIADPAQCERAADAAMREFGRIDVLVNNAFIQPPFETIGDHGLDAWREAFEVNVLGSLQMTKAVLPSMRAQRSGSIVFVNSMASRRIMPELGAYAATKSALLSAVKTLAAEEGPHGIRVNSVVPGYVWGPNLEWWFNHLASEQGRTPEEVYAEVASGTALGTLPTSEQVAHCILFMACELSSAVTGQSLDVNAGHWFH